MVVPWLFPSCEWAQKLLMRTRMKLHFVVKLQLILWTANSKFHTQLARWENSWPAVKQILHLSRANELAIYEILLAGIQNLSYSKPIISMPSQMGFWDCIPFIGARLYLLHWKCLQSYILFPFNKLIQKAINLNFYWMFFVQMQWSNLLPTFPFLMILRFCNIMEHCRLLILLKGMLVHTDLFWREIQYMWIFCL